MKTFLKTTGWLVMAAALIFGTAACSSDDDAVKQPQNPAEPQVYTMTVTASKGDDATTRALTLNDNELNAAWAAGEKVYVHNESKDAPLGGYLEAKTAGTTVTPLEGELTGTIDVDDILSLGFPQLYHDYTGQDGTLATIASTYDYVWGRAKVTAINDGKITAKDLNPKATSVQFENQQAIVKFTLLDKADDSAINVTSLTIDAKDESDDELIQTYNIATNEMTCGPITITPSATNEIYAALAINSPSEPVDITLTATDENGDTYTYTKTGVTFEWGQFYTRTVKMTNAFHIVNDATNEEVVKVNGTYSLTDGESYTMSGIGSGDIKGNNVTLTIEDGTVLTGNMLTPYNGENNASIVLNGDFTLNGIFYNYEAYGPDKHYYDAGYATITSGDGNNHTLNVNGRLVSAHIHLAEHVTLRLNGTLPNVVYGYVKNADGSADIIPSEETIGSVTYNVYVGSGTVSGGGNGGGAVVTVWFNSYIPNIEGSYVVFNNDATHVTLTDTGATYQNDYGETNKCYTAPLTAGATTYTVYNSRDDALASNVSVSDGDILIYWSGGSSWVKKYW